MKAVGLLLHKDARRLTRSPLLLAALVLYPLVIALLVGLVVRYAGHRPEVALVDNAGLPRSVVIGDQRFDLRALFEEASEVRLVRMSEKDAQHALATGRVVATLTVPDEFTVKLRRLNESPRILLRVGSDALGLQVLEKMRALAYGINLELQHAFIKANLGYLDLVERGGSGKIGNTDINLIGLDSLHDQLARMERSSDPAVAAASAELARFVDQLSGAVDQVGAYLEATANPIELTSVETRGRSWVLSAQVQAYALAIALAFVSLLLGAASIAQEREERTFSRLARGAAGIGSIVTEKIALVGVLGALLSLVLTLAFGVVVETGGVTGGQPWERVPLLVLGLALAATAFGALGVLIGTLAKDASGAMLLALLAGVPIVLLGIVPSGALGFAGDATALVPFRHAFDLASAALFDDRPWDVVARQAAWLVVLTAIFGVTARLSARRLLA